MTVVILSGGNTYFVGRSKDKSPEHMKSCSEVKENGCIMHHDSQVHCIPIIQSAIDILHTNKAMATANNIDSEAFLHHPSTFLI